MSDDEPPDEGEADRRLVEELRRTGCRGPLWEATARRWAAYGVAVLHQMILTGSLARKSSELKRPIQLTAEEQRALACDDHERASLVNEAVAVGIDIFRARTLLDEAWHVELGAGLDTYVVNGCVLALANPVRRWQTALRRRRLTETYAPEDVDGLVERGGGRPGAGPRDPLDIVLAHISIASLLRSVGPVLRAAFLIRLSEGVPWPQIAERLGTTRGELDRKLRHFRDQYDHDQYGDNDD